jgi:hypothetical protein
VLRRILDPNRKEVAGDWRILYMYNRELHNLYSSPNIVITRGNEVKEDVMGRACSAYGRSEKPI